MTKQCDNTSVGVIVRNDRGWLLMFERATFPPGVAPAAGHVDGHGGWEDAARIEVAEELGLTVTSLSLLLEGWRSNRCRRRPGPDGPGHYWRVYMAETTGELKPSKRETRDARWLGSAEIQALTDRTVARANGRLSDAEFSRTPGIEPVWVQWLIWAGYAKADSKDLVAIELLAAEPPLIGGPA